MDVRGHQCGVSFAALDLSGSEPRSLVTNVRSEPRRQSLGAHWLGGLRCTHLSPQHRPWWLTTRRNLCSTRVLYPILGASRQSGNGPESPPSCPSCLTELALHLPVTAVCLLRLRSILILALIVFSGPALSISKCRLSDSQG